MGVLELQGAPRDAVSDCGLESGRRHRMVARQRQSRQEIGGRVRKAKKEKG
jgi:hypothetical protein